MKSTDNTEMNLDYWIDVTFGTPKLMGDELGYRHSHKVLTIDFYGDQKVTRYRDNGYYKGAKQEWEDCHVPITHWMNLPKKPQGHISDSKKVNPREAFAYPYGKE